MNFTKNVDFSPSKLSAVWIAVIGAFLFVLADYIRILLLRRKLPPGPFPIPVFGNYFSLSVVRPWLQYEKWAKVYKSPMTTVWNGSTPIIICNDCWTISDLLEKRAAIYSSRPKLIVMGEISGASTSNQVIQPYGSRWKLHRKLMQSAVGNSAARRHREFQDAESKVLTHDLITTPDQYVQAIERYSVSVVSIVGWGKRIDSMNSEIGNFALKMMEGVDLVIPGLYLMETIPFLCKLPAWIYAFPSKFQAKTQWMMSYFYNFCEQAASRKEECFSTQLLREKVSSALTEDEIGNMTFNLIGGGVDTTSSTTISFVLAMCAFPEIQSKAHEELDRVVGRLRAPNANDNEESLPYISALVKEVLRWRTVTVLGAVPHTPIQDDWYERYYIPKGTWIMGNVWAIHRNPRDFPDPDRFDPERFIKGSTIARPYPNLRGHNAFGWGRRVCSGQPLAEQGLFMTISRMLWAFNIKPGLDSQGREIKPNIFAFTNCENMRPQPFAARFIPRDAEIKNIIEDEAQTARDRLKQYDW
ncbi:hypothetical protein LTR84_011953 [Exophiala bonariae]|uniref:Cytochrome P450 n=1 Tax=Exophiala bonariae TaxID=1690606 RepID=A0AAV9MS52_9EURO|nr:hypothetical protein LTR84_011953 [Exophiala bonariae]